MLAVDTDEAGRKGGSPLAVSRRFNPLRRVVAFVLDFFGFSWCLLMVGGLLAALPLHAVTAIPGAMLGKASVIFVLLARDFLFEGRGIGKNLMGLQVVDRATGRPADVLQSVKRNTPLLIPLLLWLASSCCQSPTDPLWEHYMWLGLNGICTLYLAVAIGIECYLMFVQSDGLRISDKWAGTVTVRADMDFGNPFGLRKPRTEPAYSEVTQPEQSFVEE